MSCNTIAKREEREKRFAELDRQRAITLRKILTRRARRAAGLDRARVK